MRSFETGSPKPSRRALLGAGAASGLAAAPAPAGGRPRNGFKAIEMKRVFERYQSYGDKAAGGAGDNATGAWLMQELEGLGYTCARQTFEVPAFEGGPVELVGGGARASLIPQAIVVPTGAEGLRAPLRLADGAGDLRGAIALIVLPYARWSSVKGEVERRVRGAMDRGASAAVVVTTGPTGEAVALNAPAQGPLFERPVAILAPRDAPAFVRLARAGGDAVLHMTGRTVRRPAFNVTGYLSRDAEEVLVLSTPRSGWFTCAGERGPGLAVWLALATWAARAPLPADIALVATSGHEYENIGGELYIHDLAPKPGVTALWVHLGANVAARDWHERRVLAPLPSADPQRYLLASPAILPAARTAFAGLPGLEQVYPAEIQAALGELGGVLRAGYDPAIGAFGGHRFHHTRSDDLRCVLPELCVPVAEAFAELIVAALEVGSPR